MILGSLMISTVMLSTLSRRHAFTSTPVLIHWISNVQFIVEIDASNYALVAIFSIIYKNHEFYPVPFHSRTFISGELNYNTYNKKLLAIFEVFSKFDVTISRVWSFLLILLHIIKTLSNSVLSRSSWHQTRCSHWIMECLS